MKAGCILVPWYAANYLDVVFTPVLNWITKVRVADVWKRPMMNWLVHVAEPSCNRQFDGKYLFLIC